MKTKKYSSVIVFIIIMLAFKGIFSETEYFTPSDTRIVQYVDDGVTTYGTGGDWDIGRLDDSGVEIRYRTRYEFYLAGVPSNARIDSVKISFLITNASSSSYKAKFVKLPDAYYGASDHWSKFTSSGTVYASNLSYNQDYPDKSYLQLTADVTNAIKGDQHLCIGFMSQNEATDETNANIFISYITVYYSPKVTVTVQNSFDEWKSSCRWCVKRFSLDIC